MVSSRCIHTVKSVLQQLGITYIDISLGEVHLTGDMSLTQLRTFREILASYGLGIIVDRKGMLVERIRSVVVDMIHHNEELPKENYSWYIANKLDQNYTYIANIFSEQTGTTIEQFIISHKIEKVKELLMYKEMSLTQIAFRLDYSSVAHLSNQFKKVTGMNPSAYRQLQQKNRKPLELIGRESCESYNIQNELCNSHPEG